MVDARSSDESFHHVYSSTAIIVIISSALSLYNAVELILLVFTTFTAYRGLYFWSLVIATFGVIPYTLGLILFYFELSVKVVGLIINNYGWLTMVTGQSVVLYSRLGIVLGQGNEKILRFVKWMIIVDAIIFHISTTVTVFGSNYASNPHGFSLAYKYIEKIQMTGFCIQEFIISGLYVWKTLDILKIADRKSVLRIMWQLFTINIVIILLDIGLLVIEYKDLHVQEIAFKVLAYSVKLKLEFAILSKLVEYSSLNSRSLSNTFGHHASSPPNSNAINPVVKDATFITPSPSPRSIPQSLCIPDIGKSPPRDLERNGSGPQPFSGYSGSFDHVERSQSISEMLYGSSDPGLRSEPDSDLLYADAIRALSKPESQ